MLKKPTGLIKEEEVRSHIDFLQEEAQGKIITLEAAPTATAPLLDPEEIGTYNNILYWRKGDTVFVVTPSSTITVTV